MWELVLTLVVVVGLIGIVIPAALVEREFGWRAVSLAQLEPLARSVKGFLQTSRPAQRAGGYGTWIGPRGAIVPEGISNPQSLDEWLSPRCPAPFERALQGPWRGFSRPYPAREPDPWGRAYVVLPFGDPALVCWCLSAGPNGVVETTSADTAPQGDDIAVRIY